MKRPQVVYVSGAPRSGTTLLGMALGQLPGTCDVGELWALWRPAFRSGDLCGCGAAVRECPFWLSVAERSLGTDYEERGRIVGALHKESLGTLRAPQVWMHTAGWRRRSDYDTYAQTLARHYEAIAEVGGCATIIDSSKMASDALIASTIPDIDFRVIHLVRDPRAVAWSWRRARSQPGPQGRDMMRRSALAAAARWDAHNAFAEALLAPRLGERFTRVRYEDMVQNPRGELSKLARWMGNDPERVPIDGDPPTLTMTRSNHPVWGNPVRTATGRIPLREDAEWRDELPEAARVTTTLATLPLLLRYRYPLNSRRGGRRE